MVGAGVVGAACAYHLASAGVRVRLLDRSYVASGSSGACEGNVLAWDKELERELPLALRSADLWAALADELPDDFEYDRKGSVVVAETEAELVAVGRARTRARRARRRTARCSTPTRCGARSRTPRTTCRAASCIPATRSSSRAWPPPRWCAPPSRAGAELVTEHRWSSGSCAEPTAARSASRPAPASSPPAPSSSPPGVWTPELLATAG